MKSIVHPIVLTHPQQNSLVAGPMFGDTATENEAADPQVNADHVYALWGYTIQYRRKSQAFRDVQGFWLARQGRAYGFFYRDPTDFSDEGMGAVKLIDGDYRLVKIYPDGYSPYSRLITAPDTETVVLTGVSGGELTVDPYTGIVAGATSEGTATFEFNVPVKFWMNSCRPTYKPNSPGKELVDWVDIELREIRNYTVAEGLG